jgi:hypothetical protein
MKVQQLSFDTTPDYEDLSNMLSSIAGPVNDIIDDIIPPPPLSEVIKWALYKKLEFRALIR